MAVKPENAFRKWFISAFTTAVTGVYDAPVRFQKHADYATQGVPDLDMSINGITCWLEIKFLPSCSEKGRVLNVTPLQKENLLSAYRAGVPAGVLVGIKSPKDQKSKGLYLLAFFTADQIPEKVYEADFESLAWVKNELYTLLRHSAATSFDLFYHNKPPTTDDSEVGGC